MTSRAAITIARPIEDVFAVLTNAENTGKWFPVPVEEYWTSPPPHGVGSTRHAVINAFGRRLENDAVISEYDPPRRGVLVVDTGSVRATVSLDFAVVQDGTRVSVAVDSDARGIARLAMGPFTGWYMRKWREGLLRLKAMMEAQEF